MMDEVCCVLVCVCVCVSTYPYKDGETYILGSLPLYEGKQLHKDIDNDLCFVLYVKMTDNRVCSNYIWLNLEIVCP